MKCANMPLWFCPLFQLAFRERAHVHWRSVSSLQQCRHVWRHAPPELVEGHIAEIIDGRSFRLDDGREIRLAGIEPVGATRADRINALSALLVGHDVSLRGADDAPDRYGRQTAFVYLRASDTPVQAQLLSAGAALASPELEDGTAPPPFWRPNPRPGGHKGEPGPLTPS
jgi:hypothetical protein